MRKRNIFLLKYIRVLTKMKDEIIIYTNLVKIFKRILLFKKKNKLILSHTIFKREFAQKKLTKILKYQPTKQVTKYFSVVFLKS